MTSQTSLPALSVVVIGRNEGQRLAACLEAIKQVRGVRVHEVIYADSASSDGSPERARGLCAKVIELRPKRPTAAIGRNAGWRQAASEFVLLLDGDTVVHPDFPRAAAEALAEDASIAAVWGNLREVRPRASIYNRILDLDWDYAPGFTEFCGGNVMMRRAALERTGGFDEHLIAGEEPELCRRIRACDYKILHIDHPMAWHDLNMMRFGQYWKRSTRTGHAYAEVSQRFRQSADPFWAADRRRNLIRGSFWILSLVAVLLAWIWVGPLPVVLWFALLFGLSARSAWKARWKKSDAVTLLLYGLHSHLQQVPIFVGQLQYAWNHRQGKKLELIEYKESN